MLEGTVRIVIVLSRNADTDGLTITTVLCMRSGKIRMVYQRLRLYGSFSAFHSRQTYYSSNNPFSAREPFEP